MNTYDFEKLFGFPVGKKIKTKVYPDRNSSHYRVAFQTPNNSEEDIRFFTEGLMWFLAGQVTVSIFEQGGTEALYTHSGPGQMSLFSNHDGVDTKAGKPTGDGRGSVFKARTTHLTPNTWYEVEVYRPQHSDRQPIGLGYFGTDDNEIQYGDVDLPEGSVDLRLNHVDGVWVPKDSIG